LYGIEAINAHNGWAMAITGAIIVMIGLTALSTIISQLHRLIDLLDKRKDRNAEAQEEQKPPPALKTQKTSSPLSDLSRATENFRALTQEIGETFDLASLYQLFSQHDDPHPHLTIRSLREQGYLISAGQGLFSWHHPTNENKV